MGRFTGYWWSPDSRFIAFEEADATGVETWYVADPIHPEQPAHPTFYPRPGKANVKVKLGVVSVAGGKTTQCGYPGGSAIGEVPPGSPLPLEHN
jgi:dipeptidyl-peptidase-4